MSTDTQQPSFAQLGLPNFVLAAINYPTPSPIQAQTIPHLLDGEDLLGQAQTGTGKTAAFALPLLARLDLSARLPQVLILAPTRELAIQVAESVETYAKQMPQVKVATLYGGAEYRDQLRSLRQGAQIVVGTPGRVMDHIKRGSLNLSELQSLVLDEADEMLRMGFIDDVEWILEQTPAERQLVLFSATMPREIRRIAQQYLNNPKEVSIAAKARTADTVNQRVWQVAGLSKPEALVRILEAEDTDGVIIFTRTKLGSADLADFLTNRGFKALALHGDMAQNQREQAVERLKSAKLDILVATDVAARGLDVERISHVINYDPPHDSESYVHRIGRTGRAGRSGEAILFISPRERRLLHNLERSTNQKIQPMLLPKAEVINAKRTARFKEQILGQLEHRNIPAYAEVLRQLATETEADIFDLAAALAQLNQGANSLWVEDVREQPRRERSFDEDRGGRRRDRGERASGNRGDRGDRGNRFSEPEAGMQTFRIAVGFAQGVKPANIVGAIANEANISSRNIGRINIEHSFSTVDLPESLSKKVIQTLAKVRVCGRPLALELNRSSNSGKKPRRRQAQSA